MASSRRLALRCRSGIWRRSRRGPGQPAKCRGTGTRVSRVRRLVNGAVAGGGHLHTATLKLRSRLSRTPGSCTGTGGRGGQRQLVQAGRQSKFTATGMIVPVRERELVQGVAINCEVHRARLGIVLHALIRRLTCCRCWLRLKRRNSAGAPSVVSAQR